MLIANGEDLKVAPGASKKVVAQELGRSGGGSAPQNSPLKPHGLFHDLFDIVVVLKALNGFAEIAIGMTFLFLKVGAILQWVQWLTQSELLQDPHDLLATSLEHWAMNFGHNAQIFSEVYLMAHGVVKLTIAILLFKERPWVFPFGLILFTALVAFSLHHVSIHWSWALAGFILFDLFTIGIIAKEWRAVEKLK